MQTYIDFIVDRNMNEIYEKAITAMNYAETEEAYLAVAREFERIPEYKDVSDYIVKCKELAENARLTKLYNDAVNEMQLANSESEYKTVANKFAEIILGKGC